MIPNDCQPYFELLPEALLVCANGRVLYANAIARQLFGAGETMKDVPIDVPGATSQTLRRIDGSTFEAEVSTTATKGEDGAEATIVIVRDVSTRTRAAREAEQARRTAALERVAHSIAHELNNVLMGAGTFATVLSRKLGDEDAGVKGMRTALERGKQVTAEILRFARGTEPARREIEVESWLRDVVAEISPSIAPATVLLRIDNELPSLQLDRNQMTQAITNLLLRARDAMPGGVIDLVVRRSADQVRIAVTDRGAEITPDVADVIFEPSFSTKKAAGIAMAVAQQVVLRHGGRIEVASEGGRTTFTIVIDVQ